MSVPIYTPLQRDALAELANIGCGRACTALGELLGRVVDLSVPTVQALDLADAVEALGPAEDLVTAVVLPTEGDMEAAVMLVFEGRDVARLGSLLGVDPADHEMAVSAMSEIGNILGANSLEALMAVAGIAAEPGPPVGLTDMRAALVSSALASSPTAIEAAILIDTRLRVEGEECSITFVLLAGTEDIERLLRGVGLGTEG